MVPSAFQNFFVAGTGAGAALIGLLFVAIAVAPERFVMGGALSERRAVASSSFMAFFNAFFISFGALLPSANMAWLTLVMSALGLFNSLFLGVSELWRPPSWQAGIRRVVLILTSLILYGFELYFAILLVRSPGDAGSVFNLATLVMGTYGLGIIRAWELLGASRFGITRWLNPLHDINENHLPEADKEKPIV